MTLDNGGRMSRPPIERYLRLTIEVDGELTVEPGLEFREGEELSVMRDRLQAVVDVAINLARREVGYYWSLRAFPVITGYIESAVREYWPDRAWFVEVHSNDGWTQIFQPYGVPKNQP